MIFSFFVFATIFIGATPTEAKNSLLSVFTSLFEKPKESLAEEKIVNAQTIGLLQAATNPDLAVAKGGGDITVVGGTALLPETGPSGTSLDVGEIIEATNISLYVVRKGDTISSIAKLFGVSRNTIVWANDIKNNVISPGQTLVILPVSGVRHTVAKGDTLKSIASKYKADSEEILQFNALTEDASLAVGDILIIPDGEIAPPKLAVSTSKPSSTNSWRRSASGPSYEGYYMRPLIGGIKTQGLHGFNAVDIASYYGAPIFAAAEGVVLISRTSGWNAGYGNYVVVKHDNGTQTLYAHLSKNLVAPGEIVTRGQQVGEMGASGKATGTHLHFEIRGATNPF